MQWPHEAIDPVLVTRLVRQLGDLADDPERSFVRLLERLRAQHPAIAAWHYDLRARVLPGHGPRPQARPRPVEPVVEMAPFVVPRPWCHATPEDVRSRPVVLVTPRNAFRLGLLQSLFPRARMRVVHLVRNPAASVNGLRDGWLHPHFARCRIPQLRIRGYTDAYPERGDWWCFDLPPAWRSVADGSLEEVCAFQWRTAHEAILESVERLDLERHVVRFEDIVGTVDTRHEALAALADFVGVEAAALLKSDELPTMMATATPNPARWRQNTALLDPVVRDPAVLATAAAIGYGTAPTAWR